METPAATSQQSPHLARVDTETNEGGSSNRPVDKQTYLRGSKLVFVSTAFSLAGIMMAIDGSILGGLLQILETSNWEADDGIVHFEIKPPQSQASRVISIL